MVSREAFENSILNGFKSKEESRICWTGHGKSPARAQSCFKLLHCEASSAAGPVLPIPDLSSGFVQE